jgi:hypothetical protein
MKTKNEILEAIESLQVWFAAKPWGWRETATAGQIQQWEDRAREQEALVKRLEMM